MLTETTKRPDLLYQWVSKEDKPELLWQSKKARYVPSQRIMNDSYFYRTSTEQGAVSILTLSPLHSASSVR